MKTKAQLILIVLCFFISESKAQQYFNKTIDLFGKGDVCADIFMCDSNYYLGAGGLDASQSNLSLSVLKLDKNANEISSKHYFKNNNWYYAGLSNATNKLNDSLLFNCGYRNGLGQDIPYIYIYKKNLDSVKYKEYIESNKTNVIYNALVYAKKYIYLIGYTDSSQTNSDILLMKLDTAGTQIWKKKIGTSTWDESVRSIDTIQGQLVISGIKVPHSTSNAQGFVMRLDTAGNVLWQKTVITNGGYNCNIKTLKDGNILAYSSYKTYTTGGNSYFRLQAEKLTANNVSLWSKKYNAPAIGAEPYSALENKHGNIVIVGQAAYLPGIAVNGVVNEIAQNGDSLLHKEFYYQQGCQNYFRDVIQATDGGYCFAGFFTPVFANGCTGTQDIWLLKVDSNFCESAVPCVTDVGISEAEALEATEKSVRVYPNPTNGTIYFAFKNKVETQIQISLININGQLVKTKNINEEVQATQIDTDDLIDGIYFYRITSELKLLSSGKIVLIK